MPTSFIEIDDIKIAYKEINPDAKKTLFFIHGICMDKDLWRKQYADKTFSEYRIIIFDLPGHGESGKAMNASAVYSVKKLAGIVVKLINALRNNKPYLLAGLSFGANIVAEMLSCSISSLGIILVSPSLLGGGIEFENFAKLNTHLFILYNENASDDDIAAYTSELMLSSNLEDKLIVAENYKATDNKFRTAIGKTLITKDYSDEIVFVQQKNIPALIIFGKQDRILHTNYLNKIALPLWQNKIFTIESAGHLINVDEPESFNKLLIEFADDVLDSTIL